MRHVIAFGLLIPALLLGCFLDKIGGGTTFKGMDRTPMGWHVDWVDQGTLVTGRHTKLEVYQLFDAAMTRAAVAYQFKTGRPAAEYLKKIKDTGIGFILRDHFMFPVQGVAIDFPGAAYASGETQGPAVTLAFYNKASSTWASDVPADAPVWTVIQGKSGTWYWAVEYPGSQYPALEYETFVNILGL